MHKQSSNSSKYIFPKLSSDNKRITTPKNNFKKFNFDINNNNNNKFLQKNLLNIVKNVIVIYANIVFLLMIKIIL